MKGGVGKTTISVGTAFELAQSFGKKVLLIDLDSQTNATLMILNEEKYKEVDISCRTLADLFSNSPSGLIGERKEKRFSDLIIENPWGVNPGCLDLIPSSIRLFETKDILITRSYSERFLKNKIDEILLNKYDYCIIDCPPDFDRLVIAALTASDYYIIPVRPDYLSQQGLIVLERKLSEIRNHIECKFLGIVISLIPPRGEFFIKIVLELENKYKNAVLSKIKQQQEYSKWPSKHKALGKRYRTPFIELAKHIIERCK